MFFGQNVAEIFDRVDQFLVLAVDLFALEAGELIKAKIKNLICLVLTKRIAAFYKARLITNPDADLLDLLSRKFEGEQFHACFIPVGRTANDSNKFVQVGQRDEITFERFRTLFRFAQFEARAP